MPRKSLRAAINALCKECIYDDEMEESWRQQVTDCTSKKCPLYTVRPKTTRKKKDVRAASHQSLERVVG